MYHNDQHILVTYIVQKTTYCGNTLWQHMHATSQHICCDRWADYMIHSQHICCTVEHIPTVNSTYMFSGIDDICCYCDIRHICWWDNHIYYGIVNILIRNMSLLYYRYILEQREHILCWTCVTYMFSWINDICWYSDICWLNKHILYHS